MPPDNLATVAVGAFVQFPQAGLILGGVVTALTADEFMLNNNGAYLVYFQVSVTEAGQLGVEVNGTLRADTVCGRATGTSQITGMSLLAATAGTVLRIQNPATNSTALTVTPQAGGASPVSARLLIQQLA
jgi:hypothetical protein